MRKLTAFITAALLAIALLAQPAAQDIKRGRVRSIVYVLTTPVANVTTGETDFGSFTLPAGTLNSNGNSVRITAWGNTAANTNQKNFRVYFGGSTLGTSMSTTTSGVDWRLFADVIRTGASAQAFNVTGIAGVGSNFFNTSSTLAINTANAIIIKTTGQAGAGSSNDITETGMIIEVLQ